MLQIIPVEAFTDNYIWLIHDGIRALVVDPGDAKPVIDLLQREHLSLEAILITHHHGDHTGGIADLASYLNGPIYAPCAVSIPNQIWPQQHDGCTLLGITWKVYVVPGHTQDHVAYWGTSPHHPHPMLFCGDTLFSAGCGRVLQGTAEQLYQSLQQLAQLPPDTEIYCSHEYTIANLRFALAADPHNPNLHHYLQYCSKLRAQNQATLPSKLAMEKTINPFLRCAEPDIIHSALEHGAINSQPLPVFTALRQWKNHFQS